MALHPQPLNLISLCTGGGGLDLGVELAIPDARSVVLVEGEAWSVATLVSAMENGLMAAAPVWSDVRTFDGKPWRGIVDGLIGGIPCQPHSLAGKRLGEDDERDLWSPARRIIVQSRPWFVLIENVRGMLSAAEGLEPGALRVWRDLQRIGFEVEFGIFTAEEVGASHERQRVFILGVGDTDRPGLEGWRYERSGRSGKLSTRAHGCELANTTSIGRSARSGSEQGATECRRTEPSGNGGSGGHGCHGGLIAVDAGAITSEQAGMSRGAPVIVSLYPPGPSDLDGWRRVLENSPHLEPAVRRMADGVAARLDLAGPHAARIERLRMLGNGVVPLQAAYALRTLATRLARRSAGAAALVRMMEQ